jgi:hypothetical protein
MEVLNYGFKGKQGGGGGGGGGGGVMDIETAKYMVAGTVGNDKRKPGASVIVIDCLPDMTADQVTDRTAALIQFFRSTSEVDTPIVLVEAPPDTSSAWFTGNEESASKNRALKAAFDGLVKAGVQGLHYVTSADLFASAGAWANPTVFGTADSTADLGQYALANFWASALPKIMS